MRNLATASIAAVLIFATALGLRSIKPHVSSAAVRSEASQIPGSLLTADRPPPGLKVSARSFASVPGALICPDYKSTTKLIDLYREAAVEQEEDQQSDGQARLLRGPSAATPNPKSQGCVLVSPGTALWLEYGNVVPVVSSEVGSVWVRGVTSPDMFTPPELANAAAVAQPASPPVAVTGAIARYGTRSTWLPANQSAEETTGEIGFSAARLELAGQGYAVSMQRALKPEEFPSAAAVFNSAPPLSGDAFWFRVAIASSAPMLHGKQLCGDAAAGWMLAMVFDEPRDLLQLAFYKGSDVPDLAPPALTDTNRLCGTFRYVPGTGEAADTP